jgi:hypothetical protein
MKQFIRDVRLMMLNFAMWLLDRIVFYWNTAEGQEPEHIGFPISVIYINGDIEVLPLEREVKIGTDGTVYFKDPVKNKWIPYPEIVEIVFTVSRM